MDINQAIIERHSVRRYQLQSISVETIEQLKQEILLCQQESGLRIELILDEPQTFHGFFVHYGRFQNVRNYIAMIGNDSQEEKAGYYGERVVLKAQQLGLNTCWVAATYQAKKVPCQLTNDEKIICVIALGYGETAGKPHKSLPVEKCCLAYDEQPEWFQKGMQAVMLAPTAMNSQKFFFTRQDGRVEVTCHGSYAQVNLGIIKYHFEQGAQKDSTIWI